MSNKERTSRSGLNSDMVHRNHKIHLGHSTEPRKLICCLSRPSSVGFHKNTCDSITLNDIQHIFCHWHWGLSILQHPPALPYNALVNQIYFWQYNANVAREFTDVSTPVQILGRNTMVGLNWLPSNIPPHSHTSSFYFTNPFIRR